MAPPPWSKPTPPTSTSAGTRCPTPSVGYHGNKQPHPARASGLAWASRLHGNTAGGHRRPLSLYACLWVCVLISVYVYVYAEDNESRAQLAETLNLL